MDATTQNLPIVAAVAIGASEALELNLEPAVRLQTIAVEAASNVIAHAYPIGGECTMEMQICRDEGELHVRVRDQGVGIQIPPGGGDPPGLGLSMISSLAERYRVSSGVRGGTSLDATIDPDAGPASREGLRATSPPAAHKLEFSDPSFMQPVLGRALAAEVSAQRTHLDRLEETLQVGDAIAEHLPPARGDELPALEFFEGRRPHELLINVGPLVASATERLVASLRLALGTKVPSLRITSEPANGGARRMLLTLPI
jgi:anti-sigma regulatory factor (Ser/Thr protein kinase)